MRNDKGEMMSEDKGYDISVLVVTYHSDLTKLQMTLRSILLQETISVQIVIADDGSETDYFEEVKSFFQRHNFTEYVLIKNDQNVGTVKNLLSGLNVCTGKYVKTISPGDYLNGPDILQKWKTYMDDHNYVLSGADAIYYRMNHKKKMTAVIRKMNPQKKNLQNKKLKENYLLCEDLFLGAATMCERQTINRYLSMIVDKVQYAEDNIYRLMIYNDEPVGFFDEKAVLYETGVGISTRKSEKWQTLLRKDWNATNRILLNLPCDDLEFKRNLSSLLNVSGLKKSLLKKLLFYLGRKGMVQNKLKTKFLPRLSSGKLPHAWLCELSSF